MTDRATTPSSTTGRPRRPAPRGKSAREVLAGRLFFWSGMAIVAFGLLPVIVVAVIGLMQGTVPTEADGGILGFAPGYPVFQPPFLLLWLPALGMLALTVITWPFPSRFPTYFWGARYDMSVVSAVGLGVVVFAAVAFGGPQLPLVLPAAGAFLIAMIVFGVRGLIEFIRDGIDLRAGRTSGARRR